MYDDEFMETEDNSPASSLSSSGSHPGFLSIIEVNKLDPDEFEWLFENVVNGYPLAAQHVANFLPFPSNRHVKKCFFDYLDNLKPTERKDLLISQPDILGQLVTGQIKHQTIYKRESAEYETIPAEEKQSLLNYNQLYRDKFGIPFISASWDNKEHELFTSLKTRIQNTDKQDEWNVAFEELKKLCNKRINHILMPDLLRRPNTE